jgi:hypothetical protein
MSITIDPSPPAPGLVRRVIDGVEHWVHELTGEIHSLFVHNRTVLDEVETTAAKDATAVTREAGVVTQEALTAVAEKL